MKRKYCIECRVWREEGNGSGREIKRKKGNIVGQDSGSSWEIKLRDFNKKKKEMEGKGC